MPRSHDIEYALHNAAAHSRRPNLGQLRLAGTFQDTMCKTSAPKVLEGLSEVNRADPQCRPLEDRLAIDLKAKAALRKTDGDDSPSVP